MSASSRCRAVIGLKMLELPPPIIRLELGEERPSNVFLIAGAEPGLVGAGHPRHADELVARLAEHGVRPSDIRRIVAGSWAADVLGGAAAFPAADLFVTSPDMMQPRAWNQWTDSRRARVLGVADEVLERVEGWTRSELEGWLDLEFPSLTNHLDFVPLRNARRVVVGGLQLEVIAAPGPNPGHSFLWNADQGICFCGDLELDGLPLGVDSARDYLIALERAADLAPEWLLPSHGAPSPSATRTLKRLARFCDSYMSTVPAALREPTTLMELVDRDLGHVPDDAVVYLQTLLRQRPFLEELVSARAISADGAGLDRKYFA
jgi:glyoxylase-like metal-dependent hydrolase (beta-lactamase superfamily II)